MIEDPVAFHVGWQKAASTTLQFDLFAQHSEVSNLGKPSESSDFYRYILWTEAADYDSAKSHAIWQETVAPNLVEGKVPVYSYENFATLPGIDRTLAAQRLANLFPNGRAILLIRNQISLLESLFTHLLVTGKVFGTFEDWLRAQLAFPYNTFVTHARFFEIYDLYRRLFGADRVLILLFEDLQGDKDAFARHLSEFLQIDKTETTTLLSGAGKRKSRQSRWNALIHQNKALAALDSRLRPLLPAEPRRFLRRALDHRMPAPTTWPPALRRELSDYYRAGNRRLATELGLPLERYAYPL